MIKNFKYSMLLYILQCTPAAALTYQWPYTEQVEIELTSPTEATYTIKMSTATVTDRYIEAHTSLQDVVSDKLGVRGSKVSFYSYHRHNNPYTSDPRPLVTALPLREGDATITFQAFAERITALYGRTYLRHTHFGSVNGSECVGTTLGFEPSSIPSYFDSWLTRTWNGGVTSQIDSCVGTPPVNQWCALITPELTLNYEKMNVANAAGAKVSGPIAVECTTGMKYTLRLRSPQGIALSNGMTANLLANNLPLNSALSGRAGRNTLNITSILSGTPRSSGPFEGTGILYVSYP